MDGGGRVAESLTGPIIPPGASACSRGAAQRRPKARPNRGGQRRASRLLAKMTKLRLRLANAMPPLARLRRYRFVGALGAALIILGGVSYGAYRGGHLPSVIDWLKDARDVAANAAGFRIAAVSIAGHKHLSRDEVLAIAGVSGRTSLLFLDAAEARARLRANPWVGDATVQKLYPDRLTITVTERVAFALWQKDGEINVIAPDGTVLEQFISRSVATLPFVVGAGAETRAKDFLAELDRHPGIRDAVRASVLVGERRWNLKLKNGVDVKLPETDVARALDRLAALDRDNRLLARDISAVDLRVPGRVIVQLSDGAAQAREEALKVKRAKPKGGSA
jgi:cell division protein FtsQ